ncbi:hypothetical protein [Desulforamulus putei]|uniref:Uncharacterized protein n=1 Tax=Desulforamulus putei DSM 12395 TaxID=1121429 RepID=A0A1M5C2B0_9FIRM|nr:hypothetical protein [Desulforamulus putei]SHF48562.1 hypothetical protein SAMN02745133_02767 [Desulforamulus putei DSM 12395]
MLFLAEMSGWLANKINFWRKITLANRQHREEGYVAPRQDLEKLLGLQGVAATPLRPAGAALIDGHLNPAMLKNGIVLSEILGPPAARRRRNRVCH